MSENTFGTVLKRDLPASLVVFLVAVPLSLGIAVASGAPVMAGLIAAVIGGIVGGLAAGAPLQVSGPAAGLTVIVFSQVQQFGWPIVCAITAVAGLVQLVLGALRVARGTLAISPSVVHGMLAGIGVVIALAQLHVVLGGTPESSAMKNLRELPGQIADLHGPATLLGLLTIGILVVWRFLPARVKAIPAPLVAVTIATVVSVLLRADVARVDLPNNLYASHVWPRLPDASQWGAFAIAVLTVAIIASVESLLSAVAVDKLHDGPRANLDRELMGQGITNMVSGLVGGLPVTGVIVRSSANVNAGAKTRASAILHGVWVLLFVALLGSLIEQIPLCVLAGLLVFVGVNLVNPAHIREVTHHREAPIYFATIVGVVGLNLLAGVGIGIGLSILMTLRRLASTKIGVEERGGRWHARIEGTLTFGSVPQLTRELAAIPAGSDVDIDLSVDFMDHAAFEALHSWRLTHERLGGHVDIDERHEDWYRRAEEGRPRDSKSTPITAISSLFLGRRRLARPAQPVPSLIEGIQEFQRSGRPAVRSVLSDLARDGQSPRELFITCCDSRVVPTLFTASGPGDLFKVRNIGNIVPTHSATPEHSSVGAAIEYAIDVLKVENIVVCGHSSCGAMNALLSGGVDPEQQPMLSEWLGHASASLARYQSGAWLDGGMPASDQLSLLNVAQQLENLRTYPKVAAAESEGRVRLLGMFFAIDDAQVYLYDEATQKFRQVDRETPEQVALTANVL
jgi:carbonic anhydrase